MYKRQTGGEASADKRRSMRQLAVERESTRAAAKATATAMAVWWYGMFALCAQENWLALAKKIFFSA